MADPLFKSTLLAQTQDPLENQKAALDLLKKVNDVHALSAAGLDGLQASIDALTAALTASLPVSGSNANGNWIKLYDGTMIQWGIAALSTTFNIPAGAVYTVNIAPTITYPIPFVGYSPSVNITTDAGIWCTPYLPTPTQVQVIAYYYTALALGTWNFNWIAIGKWK